MNYDHPMFKALRTLIDREAGQGTGRSTFLKVFIDPGRTDIYLEGANGYHLCIPAGGEVHLVNGEWMDGEPIPFL